MGLIWILYGCGWTVHFPRRAHGAGVMLSCSYGVGCQMINVRPDTVCLSRDQSHGSLKCLNPLLVCQTIKKKRDVIKGCCFVANSSMQTIMFLNTVGTYCALRCVGRPQCSVVNDTGWFMLIPTYCCLLGYWKYLLPHKEKPPVPEMLSFSNNSSVSPRLMYCMCVNNGYNYHCGAWGLIAELRNSCLI